MNVMSPIAPAGEVDRFGPQHLEAWRRDGGVSIPNFFSPEEVAAVQADFEAVFGRTGADEALVTKREGQVGRFHPTQFKGVAPVPLDCGPALNLIGVHPALIAFAKQALETDKVHVYQCQAWAKFTGESDYDQPFHCDFSNHTLTAPSEDAHLNCVTILCYFSDVTEAHGPAHYVTRPDSLKVAGPEASLSRDGELHARVQQELLPYERFYRGAGRQRLSLHYRHLAPGHQPDRAAGRPPIRPDDLFQKAGGWG